jgi:hypothetical protein
MPLPRAPRVSVSIPVMYRHRNDEYWFSSRVLNLSQSGVLFAPADLISGTWVEVMLSPPVPIGTLATGPQICAGEVVRTTETGAVAMRFDQSRFVLGT